MKNKSGLFVKFSIFCLSLAVILSACGGGGGSGGSGGADSSKGNVKTSSNKSIPYGTFRADVNAATGTITFSYPDSKSSKRRSARKNYSDNWPNDTSTPGQNVTLASSGGSWDGTNKILSGNVTITNNTADTFYATHVVITSVSGGASALNENGYDPDGYAFFNHAPNGEKIAPAGTGSAVNWKFSNPSSVDFTIIGKVYADNWHQIAGPGVSFGWDNATAEDATDTVDNFFFNSVENYNGKVYGVIGKMDRPNRDDSVNTRTGGEVWEYDPTSTNFTQVNSDGWANISTDSHAGVLNTMFNNWGGATTVYNGNLYVTGGKHNFLGGVEDRMNDGGDLFRYNGSTWTKVYTNTDANALYNVFSFDGSIFAGTIGAGYGRTWLSSNQDADLAYSITGDAGTWILVMTDAFNDDCPQLAANNPGKRIGGAILGGGTVKLLDGSTHGYTGKGGGTAKPGVVLYIADTQNGGGGGRLESQWTLANDFTSDDASSIAITAVTQPWNSGSAEYSLTISGTTLTPHAHAHHFAPITHLGVEQVNVTVIDNTTNQLIVGLHAGGFTPTTSDTIRLTTGNNERGWGETGNATSSQLYVFTPSREGAAGTQEQLWLLSSNLPQGVGPYINAGGELFTVKNMQSNNRTNDSDWIRRMDSFSITSEYGYATPSTSGGTNKGGTVISPVPVYAGFDAGIDPSSPNDAYGRSEFTIFPGTHQGWMYVTVQPFQRISSGCRMYKTADGVNWITVTTDGFGDSQLVIKNYTSVGGKLYGGGGRLASNDALCVKSQLWPSPGQWISSGAITPSDSTYFLQPAGAFPSPSAEYPTAGTLLLQARTPLGEPVLLSYIYSEKVTYTSNRVATAATLTNALSANNGYLGRTLWATDTTLVLSNIPGNLGLDTSKGGVCVESEIITYDGVSGSTLGTLTRSGTVVHPDYSGVGNHNKGAPVFRTTRIGTTEVGRNDGIAGVPYSIVLGGTVADIPSKKNDNLSNILIDNEEIKFTQRTTTAGVVTWDATGVQIRTPVRAFDSTRQSAHSAGATIYLPGFDGITRGVLGTAATNWESAEDGLLISNPPVEMWVTD
ncbi:MAG: hypothetical protein HZA77_00330 [Candidatus Schekmanbacteria bacterium]|nr:hypothetical protein [Candidatus Schekmanbacteria bacterium]